ncbi:MAG TPA: efflux RND transporter periplasmic adaptor subunit [Thermoanaerobaculia bacterium]
MKRRWKLIVGIVLVLVIVAASGFTLQKRKGKGVEVTVGKVERVDLSSKVSANGTIEAQRKVDLSAHVMGQIVNLGVREGDVVKKGDFLLQIDRTQLAANTAGAEASLRALFNERDAARATLAEAEANFQRAQKNFGQQIIAQAELDRARAAIDSARANARAVESRIEQARATLAGSRDTLAKTTIHAPIPGIVTALPVEEGEVAVIGTMNNPGTVLMTISDMSVVEAVMEVDETDVPAVKVGQTATVTIDAYPNQTFAGTVVRVGSSPMKEGLAAASEAVNFEVRIQLDNPPPNVRPGFSVSAEILTGSRPKAIAIPIQALVVREKPVEKGKASAGKPVDEEGVFVYDPKESKVKFAAVKTGIAGETMIEIAGGIKEGQQIVTGPFKALREVKDGDTVRLEDEKKKKKDDDEKA